MSEGKRPEAELAWLAFDHMSEGVAIANPEGELLYMNATGAAIVGRGLVAGPPEAWAPHYGVFHVDGSTPLEAGDLPLVRVLRGEGPHATGELVVRSAALPDGVHLSVEAFLLTSPSGEKRGGVVFFRDVSARRRTEHELEARERYLQAILDNIPDVAWLKDREGRFVAVNAPLARAAGRDAAGMLGLTDLDLFPAELAERYRKDDREVMATRRTKRIEEPLVRADGVTVIIETVKAPVIAGDGSILGTTGLARDITDRKRAEDALREAKEDLEQRIQERTRDLVRAREVSVRKERLAVLGQLAGGVAHQIRNPLAAIKNASYVLERAAPLAGLTLPSVDQKARLASWMAGARPLAPEEQMAQALAIIHEEIRRADDIISGLLDYARVRVPVRDEVDVGALVAEVIATQAPPPGVEVALRCAASRALCDRAQVEEALNILVRNAFDALAEGGTLTVSADHEGDMVLVAVEDDGPGVAAEVRDRLFEPLLTTKVKGLGLGLVTARTLVEAQGGQLTFAPRERGARFELRLPQPSPAEPPRR